MSNEYTLAAEIRSDIGKGASRRLRRQANKIPAIVYGNQKPATTISLDHNRVTKALENQAFYSHILTLEIAGKKEQVVLKDMLRHPSKPKILHMDFLRITADHKLTMSVPLVFLNEKEAPGVKRGGGIISHTLTSVEISCLPQDLPEKIEIDLATLEIDHTLHLSDIKLPKGVDIVALLQGPEHDLPVVSIHKPRIEVEEPTGAPQAPEATPTTTGTPTDSK